MTEEKLSLADYANLSKDEQMKICRDMGDAVMKDYEARAKEYEANRPAFCSEGHDQKEWRCGEDSGYHYHFKNVNW